MWHLSGAWARRTEPNVLLVHYDDLCADLEGQMRGIAWRLGIAVPERAWPALTQAATFERMRDRSDQLVLPPARLPPAIRPPAHPPSPGRPPSPSGPCPAPAPLPPPGGPCPLPGGPCPLPGRPARHPSARPSEHGIFMDTASFFRRGTSGAGREILSDEEMAALPRAGRPAGSARHARMAALAVPPDGLTDR